MQKGCVRTSYIIFPSDEFFLYIARDNRSFEFDLCQVKLIFYPVFGWWVRVEKESEKIVEREIEKVIDSRKRN